MPDGEAGVSQITDHLYVCTLANEPWERCEICGLGEAAHQRARGAYPLPVIKRCPYCVSHDVDVCEHGRRPLAMDGTPYA